MFFCGTCVAGYKHSADNTYVITDNANSLVIENGVFDHLYVTRSVEDQGEDFPSWDYDTIMSADLDGSLRGGNISYMIRQISSIRIKRRRTGSYNWVTLFDVPVHEAKDLEFERYDRYAANGVGYEYALVPVVDNKEGYVNKNGITPHFVGCFLFEKEVGYSSDLELEKGTITRNGQSNTVVPLSGKYPVVIRNGDADYDSGQFKMMFLPRGSDGEYMTEGAYEYREEIKIFLNNGRPKIMKLTDGRVWMVSITNGVTEDNDTIEGYVHHSFDWVEIGDPENSRVLYDNNFIDCDVEG